MHTARSATTPLPTNLRLSRKDYPTPDLKGDHMKSVPYTLAVGSLMYAMVATRPDIAHVISIISRFMHNPSCPHWNAVKHIFKYQVGTKDYNIKFIPNEPLGLVGYIDLDYASCLDSRKSTSGYFFRFGYDAISWRLKL
jgi:ATP-binding cassette subfamily B (MDR/TAP) protein 1